MANMTFKTNLLPQVLSGDTSTYTLGDSTHKWGNIFGNLKGNADTATKLTTSPVSAYGTCSTAAATAAKVVTVADTNWQLKVGTIIGIKFTNSNSASNVTLNVNNTGAKSIAYGSTYPYTGSSTTYCGSANCVTYYMYNGTYWVWLNDSWSLNSDTYTSAYCATGAATAAKTASCTQWAATAKSYIHINFRYANSSATAITLNINSTGAKPVYINGAASSTTNYTLPAGSYIAYYDGTNYYLRTDGKLTADITGNASTATNLASARTITLSGSVTGSANFDGSGDITISTTTNHTHNYAGSSSAGGSATSAVKLDSDAGSTTQPIYFSGGKPTACGTSLAVSITGNAATANRLNITTTDNAIARFNGTDGTIQNSGLKIDDNNHLIFTNTSYGSTLPSSGSEGQIFFKLDDSGPSLPSGGTAGQFLVKNSSAEGDASWATPNYLPLSGGTMSGSIDMATTPGTRITGINGTAASSIGQMYTTAGIQIRENGLVGSSQSDIRYAPTLGFHWGGRVAGNLSLHSDHAFYFYTHLEQLATVKAGAVWGAVWNDYAEFRQSDTTEPGRCIVEVGDDTLELSTERMQPGAEIISDTFGFAIGETDTCRTPIAVSGRVLAYPYENREEFKKNIGRPVCSGPNGTVSIMTDEEYKEKAYCSIGTISAVSDYETWGTGNVKVDDRIWIRIR